MLLASVIEAQRQGPRGFRDEFALCCGAFGFAYADVRWPARLYHGSADSLVAGESARWLRSELRRGLGDAATVELVEAHGTFRAFTAGIISGRHTVYYPFGYGTPFFILGVMFLFFHDEMGTDPRCFISFDVI